MEMTERLKAMQKIMETKIGALNSRMDTHQSKTYYNQETVAIIDANQAKMLVRMEAKTDANL
jgi:hypothetical protein